MEKHIDRINRNIRVLWRLIGRNNQRKRKLQSSNDQYWRLFCQNIIIKKKIYFLEFEKQAAGYD